MPAKQRERRGGTRRSALGSERKVHANPSRGRASGASPSGSQQCGVPSIGAWWVISRLHNWDDVRLDQPPYGRRGGGIDLGNVRSTPGGATMHRALNRRVVWRGIYSRRLDTWANVRFDKQRRACKTRTYGRRQEFGAVWKEVAQRKGLSGSKVRHDTEDRRKVPLYLPRYCG